MNPPSGELTKDKVKIAKYEQKRNCPTGAGQKVSLANWRYEMDRNLTGPLLIYRMSGTPSTPAKYTSLVRLRQPVFPGPEIADAGAILKGKAVRRATLERARGGSA